MYHFGLWDNKTSAASSNLHEGKNLVDVIEIKGKARRLDGVELFMFTDNSVLEGAY